VALGVLVVVAALVAALVNRPSATAVAVYSPLVGKQAPAINGVTVTGQPFALSSLEGRWVVLDFFASWCGPCQEEQPNLVAFAYQHQGPEAPALVGVVYGDTASNVLHFMSSTGATWPAVTDPNAQIAFAYGVRGTPETFLISPSGRVVAHLDAPVSTVSLDQLLARAGAAT
jgi:cytochrome c biogenesis protein CcmG/thiol:disulfide interchange protein DsbE